MLAIATGINTFSRGLDTFMSDTVQCPLPMMTKSLHIEGRNSVVGWRDDWEVVVFIPCLWGGAFPGYLSGCCWRKRKDSEPKKGSPFCLIQVVCVYLREAVNFCCSVLDPQIIDFITTVDTFFCLGVWKRSRKHSENTWALTET